MADLEDYDGSASFLDICSKEVESADKVADFLMSLGVSATVKETITVVREVKTLWKEPGCSIAIHGIKHNKLESKVWLPLKAKYNLYFGVLTIPGHYQGCVLNYMRPTACNCRKL